MSWAGHVERMGRKDLRARFWPKNVKERDHMEDPDLYGKIILKYIFEKWDKCTNWIELAQDKDR